MGKRHRRIRARSATGQVAGAATEKPGLNSPIVQIGLPSLRSPKGPSSQSAEPKPTTGRQPLHRAVSCPEQHPAALTAPSRREQRWDKEHPGYGFSRKQKWLSRSKSGHAQVAVGGQTAAAVDAWPSLPSRAAPASAPAGT